MKVSICVAYQNGDDLVSWRKALPEKGVQIVACRTAFKQIDKNAKSGKLVLGSSEDIVALHANYLDYDTDFDFSDVRNFMDEQATGDWIIHIDADERLAIPHEEFWAQMYALNESGANAAFLSIAGISNEEKPTDVYRKRYCLASLRIHRKASNIRWKGICHETLDIENKEITLADTGILLNHDGYAVDDASLLQKLERNAKLMVREYTREKSKRNWDYLINTFSHIHKLTR